MRKLLIVVLAASGTAVALGGLGDYGHGGGYHGGRFDYQQVAGYYTGTGGEFRLTEDAATGTNSLQFSLAAYANSTKGLTGDKEWFQSFCVETNEYIQNNIYGWVSTQNVAKNAPGTHAWKGGGAGDDLDPMTAYLYTRFAQGVLRNYNYTPGPGRAASADSLQKAIWFIEGEGGAATFYYYLALDAVTSGSVNYGGYGGMLNLTDEWVGKGIGMVRVLQMYSSIDGSDGENPLKQDQLVLLIPTPQASLLGATGIAVIGLLRRR